MKILSFEHLKQNYHFVYLTPHFRTVIIMVSGTLMKNLTILDSDSGIGENNEPNLKKTYSGF